MQSKFFSSVLWLAAAASLQAAEMVPFRSAGWKYVLGTQEASNPTDVWRLLSFDDAAWLPAGSTASAPVGYPSVVGSQDLEGSVQTMLPTSAAGAYTSVFLRKSFVVANAAEVTGLNLQVQYDDGFVAWLNGVEVGRAGVADPLTISTLASDHEVTVGEAALSPSAGVLVSGTNVLALQLFNSGASSSDIFIDARLSSTVDDPPVVVATEPPPSGIVLDLGFVTIAFSENVSGVDAADLRVNGVAATNVVQNSPREYTFQFPQPPTGSVAVAWAPSPGIADTDGLPTAFVPGPGWTYMLDPNAIAEAVVISEFMADNENGVQDEDGNRSDWLELYNPGLVDVSLNGWFLTDTATNLAKWPLPNFILGANKYLRIWASEKDRRSPAGPLHTNFKLSKNAGSFLALVGPATNIVSSFSGATYPAQQANVSFGRDRVDPNLVGYFLVPTPGAQNSTSGTGFAPAPALSLESGVYTNASLSMVITVPPGTTVRYTTDGTAPTNSSTAYTGPITVQNNTTLKVRAFPTAAGLFPSEVLVRNFVFLDATTRDFNSNLPILIMSTDGRTMVESVAAGSPRTKGTFVVFDTFRGRSAFSRKPDYIGPADFEVFGQTSAGFAKRPYNVEIQDALGNDKKESILGLPAEADWKLRNPYADKCLMNDYLAYELFEQMGNYSCRRRFVEVFVDTGIGRLSYPGDYIGVEVFLEKIERGNDRVDIAELTPSHTTEPSVTGGFMFKKDKDSGGDLNFTAGGASLKLHEPKPRDMRGGTVTSAITAWPGPGYTPSASNQMSYLVNYLNAFNTAMSAADWTTRTGTNHYSHYIDVDSFVDSHWIVEFPKQIDGYRISNFFTKDRNGKVKNSPIWDWNLAFGNADYLDGGNTNNWYYVVLNDPNAHIWLSRLVGRAALPNSGGDPDFIQKVIDRWGTLRTNVFNGERLTNRIDEIARDLTEAAGRNFTKYNYLNTYQWPNPQGPPTWHVDYTQPTYELIISEMKKWTYGRYLWIDGQFPKGPTLTLPEGDVTGGSSLVILAPAGTIYYTLDGTDPRASQSNGAVAAGAQTYNGPIALNDNARVFARARVGTVWSPPAIATYVVQRPRLVVTEIMYHPPPPPGTNNVDEDFEYLELRNVGATPLNVNGCTISGGVGFTFPDRVVAAGERVLVVKNTAAFNSRYPGLSGAVVGEFTGNLANNGNRISLKGRLREPILDFSYNDEWYPVTDGFGFSLVIVNDNAAADTWSLASSWRPSGVLNGTPGQGDGAAPSIPEVVINEILTHSDPAPPTDTIELRNLSAGNADVSGWYLTDDFRSPKKFRIPNGTVIPAGGYVTFDESAFNAGTPAGANVSFSLSSFGEEVYLFSATTAGELTGYVHGFQFGAALSGVTFGRHITSQGVERLVSQSSATLGGANAGPLVGPIVVSEIMYRPQDVPANGAYWDDSEDEFIELRNITGAPVNLFDPARPTNTWKLEAGVEFRFAPNTTIAANGYLLLVNFNPATEAAQLAAFRAKYGVGAGVSIVGPYQGKLNNSGEKVALYRPDVPETTGGNAGEIPWVLVDDVTYSDHAPWPTAADGLGHSLQRVNLSAYGNDPVNWAAGAPSAAAAYVGGSAPVISAQPSGQTVGDSGTESATFSVGAIGAGPIRYQWLFNGQILNGATNSTLVVQNVKASQAGQYSAYALNPFGAALSSPATLIVLIAPKILAQPSAQRITEGGSAAFAVVASSANPPVTYQWMKNGQPIPGATGPTFVLNSVTSDVDDGDYHAVITDSNGFAITTTARLTVLLAPQLISPNPRLDLTAVAGETVTLGTQVRGTKPIWLQWRKFSLAGANQGLMRGGFINTNMDFFTTNIVSTNAVGIYTVQFTNIAGGGLGSGTQRTNAILTILADSNGNGIPDNWETAYFGSATGADRDADTDGDGMKNWQEYIAGTIPTNAASYLKVETVSPAGGATITFPAAANRTYTIEYKDGLDTLIWTRLGDIVPKNVDWTATITDPSPTTNRYYRIATPRRQ